jgi:hypothetical protein
MEICQKHFVATGSFPHNRVLCKMTRASMQRFKAHVCSHFMQTLIIIDLILNKKNSILSMLLWLKFSRVCAEKHLEAFSASEW